MKIDKKSFLSKEEESALLEKRKIDPKAREKLILSNLRLVHKITSRMSSDPELFGEGVLGLIEAIDRFDFKQGERLSTYATFWIRCRAYEWILNNYKIMKMPVTTDKKKIFFQINRKRQEFWKEGIVPTTQQLAYAMSVKEEEVDEMIQMMKKDIWLDAPLGGESEEFSLADTLESSSKIEEEVLEKERNNKIKDNFKLFQETLSSNEKIILSERIFKEKKLKEVGGEVALSVERVRQLEEKIIKKLKDFSKIKNLKELVV